MLAPKQAFLKGKKDHDSRFIEDEPGRDHTILGSNPINFGES